jgi:hypothetical protein
MKRWSIPVLVVSIFLSSVSYGDISFGTDPYIHPNSFGLPVDYDDSPPDGYILVMSKNGRTIHSTWQRFISLAGITYDSETGDVFVMEYISPRNYQVSELSSSVDYFVFKEPIEGYGWDRSLVYGSNTESFYVNGYKGDTLNRFSIDGFNDYTYEKSYDLNSLISEMYIVILIGLLVFSTIRAKMRFRSL